MVAHVSSEERTAGVAVLLDVKVGPRKNKGM